jgi:hypothetical protein
MKKMKALKKFLFMAFAIALVFGACKEDAAPDEPIIYPDDYVTPDPVPVTCAYPTATLGTLPALNFLQNFNLHFTNQQSAVTHYTKVLVLHNNLIASLTADQKASIKTVYDNSGVVVVIEPEYDDVDVLADTLSHNHVLSNPLPLTTHQSDIYAFDNRGHNYLLGNIHPGGSSPADLDNLSYINFINAFVEWLNKDLEKNAVPRPVPTMATAMVTTAADDKPDISKLFDMQTITHTFPVSVAGQICHVTGSSHDNLWKDGSVTTSIEAYALHAFNDQTGKGDYYVMHQETTFPNAEWYNGKWSHHHGGVDARMCAWFMQKGQISIKVKNPSSLLALLDEAPQTVNNQTTYESGMSWNLSASVTGGTQNDAPLRTATIGGGVSFNNETTHTISDRDVQYLGTGVNTAAWAYVLNNLASYNKNISINEPCLSARSSIVLISDWVWHIPEHTDETPATQGLDVTLSLDGSNWQASYFYSSGADFHTISADLQQWSDADITFSAPNRTPTGQLVVTNNDTQYVSEIKIWKSTTATTSAADYTLLPSGTSIAPTKNAGGWLPTGDYKVRLKIGGQYYHTPGNVTITRALNLNLNAANGSPDFAVGGW